MADSTVPFDSLQFKHQPKQFQFSKLALGGHRGLIYHDAKSQFKSRMGLASSGPPQIPLVPFIRQSHNRKQLIPTPVRGPATPSYPRGASHKRATKRKGVLAIQSNLQNQHPTFAEDVHDPLMHLTQLGHISKSGLRKTDQANKNRKDFYSERKKYLNVGQVIVPPRFFAPPRNTRHRVTTLRPRINLSVSPVDSNQKDKISRIDEDTFAEIEFESSFEQIPSGVYGTKHTSPKEASDPPAPRITTSDHWFLMPVQGWFTLSIVLAAVTFLLTVTIFIMFRSLGRKKEKIRKLRSSNAGLLLGGCIDPVHHELCSCRGYFPFARGAIQQDQASLISARMSHRSLTRNSSRAATLGRERSRRLAKELQSIPSNITGKEALANSFYRFENFEDNPPPLAPKMSIGNKGARNPPDGTSAKDMRENYRRNAPYDPDVQLTTIYPPPNRFDL